MPSQDNINFLNNLKDKLNELIGYATGNATGQVTTCPYPTSLNGSGNWNATYSLAPGVSDKYAYQASFNPQIYDNDSYPAGLIPTTWAFVRWDGWDNDLVPVINNLIYDVNNPNHHVSSWLSNALADCGPGGAATASIIQRMAIPNAFDAFSQLWKQIQKCIDIGYFKYTTDGMQISHTKDYNIPVLPSTLTEIIARANSIITMIDFALTHPGS